MRLCTPVFCMAAFCLCNCEAHGDVLELTNGRKPNGALVELTFARDGRSTRYTRDRLARVDLGPNGADRLGLADGAEYAGRVVSVAFKRSYGTVVFQRQAIKAVLLDADSAAKPKTVAKRERPRRPVFLDSVELVCGCVLKGTLLHISLQTGSGEDLHRRERVKAVSIRDGKVTIRLADQTDASSESVSIVIQTGGRTIELESAEVRGVKLADAKSMPPKPVADDALGGTQRELPAINKLAFESASKRAASMTQAAKGAVMADLREKVGAIDSEIKLLQKTIRTKKRYREEARRAAREEERRRERELERGTRQEYEVTIELTFRDGLEDDQKDLKRQRKKRAEVLRTRAGRLAPISRDSQARSRALRRVYDKHEVIIRAGGGLSSDRMQSAYDTALQVRNESLSDRKTDD